MNKIVRAETASVTLEAKPTDIVVVRNPSTGNLVEVKGVGALRGRTPPIEKGISLLRPIAAQVSRSKKPDRKKTTG